MKLLFYKLEKLPRRGTCRLRQQLIEETTRYFRGGDDRESFPDIEATEVHAIATLLDPRFRKSGFASSNKADTAAAVLLDMVKEIAVNESLPLQEVRPAASTAEDDDWAACLSTPPADDPEISFRTDMTCGPIDEFYEYMREKNIPRTNSPFVFWAANKDKYPRLASLSRRYLSAPMGSVASEREFKIAKRVTNNRGGLKPDNVEKLLFLKYNLRMVNYCY